MKLPIFAGNLRKKNKQNQNAQVKIMKQTLLIILLGSIAFFDADAQNSIGIQAGFLGTHTFVAEYERIGRNDYLLDSMQLLTNAGSFQASIEAEIGLGKKFFLSTGFQYSNKGLADVTFIDSTGYPWSTPTRQHYLGLSVMLGYKLPIRNSRFGLQLATGLLADFAIGMPNGGALFSGPYSRFFMPFSRFNEVDISWASEAGCSYNLGPGHILVKVKYQYGLSDVLEDPFVIGRTMSLGISVGYSFHLTQ